MSLAILLVLALASASVGVLADPDRLTFVTSEVRARSAGAPGRRSMPTREAVHLTPNILRAEPGVTGTTLEFSVSAPWKRLLARRDATGVEEKSSDVRLFALNSHAHPTGQTLTGLLEAAHPEKSRGTFALTHFTEADGSPNFRLGVFHEDEPGTYVTFTRDGVAAQDTRALPDESHPAEAPVVDKPVQRKLMADSAADILNARSPGAHVQRRRTEDGSVIDIAIYYTPDSYTTTDGSANEYGTAAMMEAGIRNAVADVNDVVWHYSGAGMKLNLVILKQVSFSYEDTSNDLARWSDTVYGTGVVGANAVATEVASKYADTAHLIQKGVNDGSSCGLAYVRNSVSSQSSFPAVGLAKYSCFEGYRSLAHELGHNIGFLHGVSGDSGSWADPNAMGYADPSSSFRTVMAYASMCSDTKCPRVGRLSSTYANCRYNTKVIGSSPTRNNAKVLVDGAAWFANLNTNPSPNTVNGSSTGTSNCLQAPLPYSFPPGVGTASPSSGGSSGGSSATAQIAVFDEFASTDGTCAPQLGYSSLYLDASEQEFCKPLMGNVDQCTIPAGPSAPDYKFQGCKAASSLEDQDDYASEGKLFNSDQDHLAFVNFANAGCAGGGDDKVSDGYLFKEDTCVELPQAVVFGTVVDGKAQIKFFNSLADCQSGSSALNTAEPESFECTDQQGGVFGATSTFAFKSYIVVGTNLSPAATVTASLSAALAALAAALLL